MAEDARAQFPHYHKPVDGLKYVDVYRVLSLFGVTDPCVQHAVKKLLVSGNRTAGKTREQDIREAVVSLNRALQMIAEDERPRAPCKVPPAPSIAPAMLGGCSLCLGKPCTKQDGCPYAGK